MTRLQNRLSLPDPVVARPATSADHAALRHLWVSFRHHMSEFTAELPTPQGGYRSERLDRALDPNRPDWAAWVLTAGDHPVGFAVTRAMDQPTKVLSSFFVVTPARRGGLGTEFAATVMRAAPGEWSVAYQEENVAAAAFWPRLASDIDPRWRRETRTPPDRPDLPPDTWLTLSVGRSRSPVSSSRRRRGSASWTAHRGPA